MVVAQHSVAFTRVRVPEMKGATSKYYRLTMVAGGEVRSVMEATALGIVSSKISLAESKGERAWDCRKPEGGRLER